MNKRVRKLQQDLANHQLDGLLVRNFEGNNQNVLYLSGFGGTTAVLLITRNQTFIITDGRYYTWALREAKGFELVKVIRGRRQIDHINEALEKAGLTKHNKVGFEAAHLTVDVAAMWKKELNVKLVPTTHIIERFRQYKDADEVRLLRKACRVTSRVYNEVAAIIRAGMTELEVAFELDMRLRQYGAITNSFPSTVAGGPNSASPHHPTGDRKLKSGEPVLMDFGGLFPGGYCSDMTRTAFVPGKEPHPKMQEIYNIVLAANKAARKALKVGMKWKEYDKVGRDFVERAGYGKYIFTHGLGHSLGLVPHDPYDYENDPFQVGTVITDEPGIYIDDFGGVRIEDDLVVTANGAERLTTAPYWKF